MNDNANTRRVFLKATSAVMAGAALNDAARAEVQPTTRPAMPAPVEPKKILNYNPSMGYRRLGKTELIVSEIALGGHHGKSPEERKPVLERAAELGMNYLDTNITTECEMYGEALRGGQRDRWHIGFASWPQKLTSEYENELSVERFLREIDGRLKAYHTDRLDLWRPVGATWGPGQTEQETMLEVTPRVLDMVVEAFDKAHKQGKLRWLGISAHNPIVFRRVLNDYPRFSVILFPYMFLTKPYGGDSLLSLAKQKDVGVIAIKPFAAGRTFGAEPTDLNGNVDSRATSLLKAMLTEHRVSAIIPGVSHPDQLSENVKASYERDKPLDQKDKQAMRECLENFHAHVHGEYQWLHHWKRV